MPTTTTTPPLDLVLSKFPNAKRRGSGYMVLCPGHEDSKPSLSITPRDDGGVLMYCFTGCSTEKVVAAIGLTMASLIPPKSNGRATGNGRPMPSKPPPPQRKTVIYKSLGAVAASVEKVIKRDRGPSWQIVKVFEYPLRDGTEHAAMIRLEPATKDDKTFRPVHREVDGWVWGDPPGLIPLYGLSKLPDDRGGRVYVVEGEGKADVGLELGLTITTSSHGAKSADKSDWSVLAGFAEAVLMPDCDDAGRAYVAEVAAILRKLDPNICIKILELPGLSDGEDLEQFVGARDSTDSADIKAEIDGRADAAPAWTSPSPAAADAAAELPKPRSLAMRIGKTIDDSGTQYLWRRRLVRSALNVIFSRPGRGKSTIAADIGARVTTGFDFPDGTSCAPGFVIYAKGEGTDASVRDRMRNAGADPDKYGIVSKAVGEGEAMIDLALDARELEDLIDQHPDTSLLLVDTLDSLFPSMRVIDNAAIRRCLWPLQDLAERRNLCVVLLAHTNKGGYADPLDRLSGGRAIGAAARAVWYLGKSDPDADDCYLSPVKANDFLIAPTLAYTIHGIGPDQPGRIRWGDEREDVSAWNLDQPRKAGDGDKGEHCREWLAALLAVAPRRHICQGW